VDPLVPGMAPALAAWLDAPGVLKVMHSASEDLIALRCACGTLPRPLYDTQVAAALAGIGAGLGYQKLVERIAGVTLPKGETRSDWMRRPLSPAQLEYAADDVVHLDALYQATRARLQELGREAWLAEDVERMLATAARDEGEPWPHLALRAAQFLGVDGQRRLARLLRWRDVHAREHDLPRTWVLDNELAVALAKDPPADTRQLQQRLDATPKAPRRRGRRDLEGADHPAARRGADAAPAGGTGPQCAAPAAGRGGPAQRRTVPARWRARLAPLPGGAAGRAMAGGPAGLAAPRAGTGARPPVGKRPGLGLEFSSSLGR
jgi:Ribonuclease D